MDLWQRWRTSTNPLLPTGCLLVERLWTSWPVLTQVSFVFIWDALPQGLKAALVPGCPQSQVLQLSRRRRRLFATHRSWPPVAGLRSFDNLNETDVVWSSAEAEDVEAALRSIVEATSWMDWRAFAMQSLALKSTDEGSLVRCLSLAGARCQLLVAKMALTQWANVTLKRRDAVLAKVKDSVSFLDLKNLLISTGEGAFSHGRPSTGVEGLP